jgi:hypothetical protein
MAVWSNPDGLRVVFGRDQAKGAQVGSPCTYGAINQMVAILEAGRMSTLAGGLIGGDTYGPVSVIPAGSAILRATIYVTEAFTSGGAATVDLGLANADGTYTNLDEDGIDVALSMANLAQGQIIACDGALVGAGADKDILADAYLSWDVDTAVLTAGKALLIVEYVTPSYPDDAAD